MTMANWKPLKVHIFQTYRDSGLFNRISGLFRPCLPACQLTFHQALVVSKRGTLCSGAAEQVFMEDHPAKFGEEVLPFKVIERTSLPFPEHLQARIII